MLTIVEAVCRYRKSRGITGPLYVGRDTHALSEPAFRSTLEVLAANDVDIRIDAQDGFTPTPVVSHAILTHNERRTDDLADGILITPSHNPPEDGGIKYNPPNGGPADTDITGWIQDEANRLLEGGLAEVERALTIAERFDYISSYVGDLSAIDLEAIRSSGLELGVDPLGGASVAFWQAIADRYEIDLEVVNQVVDPTFRFMTTDWDGKIRMDPSSPHAMASLVGLRDRFDLAVGNDADADRHGIVTRAAGLMNPNHFLSAAVAYLFGTERNGRGRRHGQDAGQLEFDRPRCGRPRSTAGRGARGLQVVRARLARRHHRLRRRGERWRVVPAPPGTAVDDRQGRHSAVSAGRRDDRAHGPGPGCRLRGADGTLRHAGLPAHRRPGLARAQGRAGQAIPRRRVRTRARGRSHHGGPRRGPRRRSPPSAV